MSIAPRILKTVERYKLFSPGEKVIVAVSGGPDSVALFHLLRELNPRLCLKLAVAHLDHGLRRSSKNDLMFVRKMAGRHGVSFYGRRLEQAKIKTKGSLEDVLRKLRYDFLLKLAIKIGASKIVVGHTLDDQAETVLMRVLRGSGLVGLAAILPKRRLAVGCQVVRPLIEVNRKQILHYLGKHSIPFCTDESNLQTNFFRNKIRLQLLPYLQRAYNPNVKEVLARLALSVGADYEFLLSCGGDFLKSHVRPTRNGYRCSRTALGKLDVALQRIVLRLMIEKLHGDLKRIEFCHWLEIEDLLGARPEGAQVHLPFDITLSKTKGYLNIFKR
ncbi:MAG: tRNA lysidine(34) synthetase TilS [Candidatus Omnitrophota bacterium]